MSQITHDNPVAAKADAHDARFGWGPLVGLLAALLAVAVWSRLDIWLDIWRIVERDPEASHIMLVPPVFAWILWTYRHRFDQYKVRAPWVGVLITLAGWGLSVYGDIRAMAVFWHLGAVLVLVGVAVAVLGLELPRRFWPALLVLVFLLPVPGTLRQPVALFLQNISAQWVERLLSLHGVDIARHGNVLLINNKEVGIAEACNGMRMMTMLFLVSYTFVFVHAIRPWVRVMLLAIAPVLALVCNIIRLVPTVLIYGYASETTATRFHDGLGWAMVVVSYLLLMGILALLRWLMIPVDDPRMPDDGRRGIDHAAV